MRRCEKGGGLIIAAADILKEKALGYYTGVSEVPSDRSLTVRESGLVRRQEERKKREAEAEASKEEEEEEEFEVSFRGGSLPRK